MEVEVQRGALSRAPHRTAALAHGLAEVKTLERLGPWFKTLERGL
jgi:hypothetical protein